MGATGNDYQSPGCTQYQGLVDDARAHLTGAVYSVGYHRGLLHFHQFGVGLNPGLEIEGEGAWDVDYGADACGQEALHPAGVVAVEVRQDDNLNVPRLDPQRLHVSQQYFSIAAGVKEYGCLAGFDQTPKTPGGLQLWVVRVVVVDDGDRHVLFPFFVLGGGDFSW